MYIKPKTYSITYSHKDQRSVNEFSDTNFQASPHSSVLTFSRFPKDEARRRAWVAATKLANFTPSKHSYLCSCHFEARCFDRTGQSVRLRDWAVPTMFNLPPHLTKVRIAVRTTKCFPSMDNLRSTWNKFSRVSVIQ